MAVDYQRLWVGIDQHDNPQLIIKTNEAGKVEMRNLIVRHVLTKKLAGNLWCLLLLLGFHLAGCQPTTPQTSLIPTTRITAIPSATSSLTATPPLDTPTNTPSPADTVAPSLTPLPNDTPTPPSWQIAGSGYFLLHEASTNVRQPEIYMLGPGEISSRFVAYGDLIDGQPWSPDGTRVVFKNHPPSQESDSAEQFAIADLGTGEVSILDLYDPYPNIFWSPDGQYLLYEAKQEQDNLAQIVLHNLAEGTNQVILEVPDLFRLAGWSFDSQKIAFVAQMDGQYDLYAFDVTTSNLDQLTDSIDIEPAVVWSPTEMELIFGTSTYSEPVLREGGPHYMNSLYLIDNANLNSRVIGNHDSILRESLSWSPDGGKITYSEGSNLCILDINNDMVECPLEGIESYDIKYAAFQVPPAWSPDGNWLAFRASGSTQCPVIYFLELQTGNVIPSDLDRCRVSPIYWSPTIIE